MRSYVPAFEMVSPSSLKEALALLGETPGLWKPFAGGTDLMVLFEAGKLDHKKFINLWNLDELKPIRVTKDFVELGALATYSEILDHPILQKEFPMLCKAASFTGSVAIQNRGTLAGNIVNASPAADSPPALLAYAASLELVSKKGTRWVPYVSFHTGYKKMVLASEELVKTIRLPRMERGWVHYYEKVGTRKEQAISKICFAAAARVKKGLLEEIRIGLGSVAPIPLRALKTEALLKGKPLKKELFQKAKDILAQEITPIDDIRSSAKYRRQVAQNLLEDFLCGIG